MHAITRDADGAHYIGTREGNSRKIPEKGTMETKKLYRSKKNRMIAGVCGGLGDYFNIDPTLVRLLFVLIGLAVGGGFLLYLLLWLIMPEEPA